MAARFYDYIRIVAKFDSIATACGNGEHKIARGDSIGWVPRNRRRRRPAETMCGPCFDSWAAENAEAEMLERQAYMGGY